jgi:hypothetical protein
VTGVRSVSPVWFDSDNGLVIGPQDHPFLAFDASPMSHSYFRQVGGVFEGYGDDLNPVEWWKGLNQLAYTVGYYGFSAAGSAIWTGTIHIFTDWMTTDDPQTFGQSFGTVLMTVAPAIKKIPNPTAVGLGGPWLTPEGSVLNVKGADLLATNVKDLHKIRPSEIIKMATRDPDKPGTGLMFVRTTVKGRMKFRLDYGELPNKSNIPVNMRGKNWLHYHREILDPSKPTPESYEGQGGGRHRPWQNGTKPRW